MPDLRTSSEDSKASTLQKKKDHFQKIANLSPNLLFVIDTQEYQIIFINNRVKELLGHKADHVYEKGRDIFREILHPDDLERRLENLERCTHLSEGEECEVEVRFRTGEGGWQWFRITERIFEKQEDGTVSQVIGTAQNIHEQKVSEEKLREEHRRLKNAQAIGSIGSFERELPGNLIRYSEEFYRILGLKAKPEEKFTLQEFMSHVHPDDRERYQAAIDHTHATGEPLDIVTRIVRPDGSTRYVHRRAAITRNEKGTPVRVYGTVQDITDRIKSEKKKKRFETLMRATEKVAGTGSYEADLRTNNIYFSEGLFRLFGEEPNSFVPSLEWLDSRSHPDDVPVTRQIREQATAGKKGYKYVRRIYHRNGSVRVIEANGNVITNEKGNAIKVIGLVQDITERKRAEEELRRSEERSRNLLQVLQNAPDAYLVLTPDLHIRIASDAYLEATFAQREEIVGKYIFDAFPDNPAVTKATGAENLSASFEQVLSSKKPHRMAMQHYDVPHPDGGFVEKYWSPVNYPVINTEGEVDYIIHRVLDVTEVMVKQAAVKGLISETEMLKTSLEEIKIQAAQLKENKALLQSVFDASPNSIVVYKMIRDAEGRVEDFEFLMLNAYTHELVEFTNDFIGQRFSEIFPHTKGIGVLDALQRTAETGVAANLETWYDGEGFRHWFHFRATKINDLLVVTTEDITERKQAEEELLQLKDELAQRARDKYRKIINSMDEGYCLLETIFNDAGECIDYRHLDINPVFEEQTGMKDVVGKTINELAPDIEPFWKDIYGKVALTGGSERIESYAEPLERWFDVFAFRIDEPEKRHVAVIFKDITKRKDAEERQTFLFKLNDVLGPLEDPNEVQFTATRMVGEHFQVDRVHYYEIDENNTVTISTGFSADGKTQPQKFPVSNFGKLWLQAYQNGESIAIGNIAADDRFSKEEQDTWRENGLSGGLGVPLIKGGRLKAILGLNNVQPRQWTTDDIDLLEEVAERTWAAVERAKAEKSLRRSEERLQKVLTIDTVGVLFFDMQSRFLHTNEAFLRMIGYTRETFEELNLRSADITLPEWMPRTREAFAELKESGYFSPYEKELVRPDGTRWWGLFAGKRLNEKENVEFVVDITEVKRTQEALMQAKEEAEAATRAKEDFVSTMSHEIRTPLNAVIGLTNLLIENDPREDQKENLDSLSFSARNLLALINDILDFSKLEAGKMELSENEFDLYDLLFSLKQAHQPQAKANGTELLLDLDEKIPARVGTDQLKLSQVLHNLVSNAVKFTREGEVRVSANLNRKEEELFWLDFSIEDTGIGIAAEKLEHIFGKFTQAESSTVRDYGGTGLGLSISKLLLELMGSDIRVDSKVGEGSRFYFSLPVKPAGKEKWPLKSDHTPKDEKDLRQSRLLLVEDVEINRKIIMQFLENWWQLKPDEAINGKEAVEMARNNDYDLILMDIRMPKMDGYEASRQIRKLSRHRNTPILALTADKNQEVQQALYTTRFDDLLMKPFETGELRQRILKHLSEPGKNLVEKSAAPEAESGPTKDSGEKMTAEPSYEISRYLKIAGENKQILQKLIANSVRAFRTYKTEFAPAAEKKDAEELSELVHKNTTSIHYIQANHLAREIEEFRELLKDADVETEKLKKKKEIVLKEFDVVIEGLESLKERGS